MKLVLTLLNPYVPDHVLSELVRLLRATGLRAEYHSILSEEFWSQLSTLCRNTDIVLVRCFKLYPRHYYLPPAPPPSQVRELGLLLYLKLSPRFLLRELVKVRSTSPRPQDTPPLPDHRVLQVLDDLGLQYTVQLSEKLRVPFTFLDLSGVLLDTTLKRSEEYLITVVLTLVNHVRCGEVLE